MPNLYIDHTKNGMYIIEDSEDKLLNHNVELVPVVITKKNTIESILTVKNIIDSGTNYFEKNTEQDEKIKNLYSLKKNFKNFSESHYCSKNYYCLRVIRKIILSKHNSLRKDRSEMLLKICGKMFNKKDYNIIVRCKEKNGMYDPIFTFTEKDFITHMDKKILFSDRLESIKIENTKVYNISLIKENIENMYYETSEFDNWFHKTIKKLIQDSPGIFFKKMKNGIPFGMWLLSKTIETENNNLMIECRKKIGELFFDDENIFYG